MTPAQIKLKRTESLLAELIPEAISQLNNARLHEIDVLEVKCARGKSDAKVYLDPSFYTPEEQAAFLKELRKARPIIEDYCLKEQGWYRCPKLAFEFDEQFEKVQHLEELFKKIAKETT
ncbi:MAG: 30S ribosome-binding factor RbfA [Sulfurimonadaceae bacterium]|nr:30S ribosome-binding factor RbfA [Sulfurimonadaceae bacterium]